MLSTCTAALSRALKAPSRQGGNRRWLHSSTASLSKPKKRSPDSHLVGTTIDLPAFIRGREFSKRVGIDADRLEKFAREEGLRFKKNASDIIFDFRHCTKFLEPFGIKTRYVEIDAVRSDYWERPASNTKGEIRPSVIAVMGEIDHGKTSLLDALSSSSVAQFEPGKITQSLSAFTVDLNPLASRRSAEFETSNSRVTFLDTPGHHAFEAMRLSGAQVSDFILLVISAADGGVKPATEKIIKTAKASFVPIVVALNKIDIATKEQIVSIYKHLRSLGVSKIKRTANLAKLEGDPKMLFSDVDDEHPVVSIVEISATNHTNMDILKRVLKELHKSMEENLYIDKDKTPSEATVIESYASPGLGRVLLLITHLGTLSVGQHFVTNNLSGVIKSLRIADQRYLSSASDAPEPSQPTSSKSGKSNSSLKHRSQHGSSSHALSDANSRSASREILEGSVGETVSLQSVGAGLPVLISGLKQDFFIPSGAAFFGVESKERSEEIMDFRDTLLEFKARESNGTLYREDKHGLALKAASLLKKGDITEEEAEGEDFAPTIWDEEADVDEERKNNLSVILKADNQGRLDALILSAREAAAAQGFELKILAQGVGDISSHDLAIAQVEIEENEVPRVPVYLFNVTLDSNAQQWMTKHTQLAHALLPKPYEVFLDILKDVASEIKLKVARQAALPEAKRPTYLEDIEKKKKPKKEGDRMNKSGGFGQKKSTQPAPKVRRRR